MARINEFVTEALIGVYTTMFNAVPGAARLVWMIQQYEAGLSQVQIANALVSSYPEDYAAAAPQTTGGLSVADVIASRLLGGFRGIVPIDDLLWARQWLADMLDAGMSYAAVIVEAVNALRATNHPGYTHAQALLENRIAFAKYLALDLKQDPAHLIEAQDLTSFIDHAPESVEFARQYIAARDGAGLTLSSGADTLTSSVFKAFPSFGPGATAAVNTLQTADVLTGTGPSAVLNAAVTARDFLPALAPVLNDIHAFKLWVNGGHLLDLDLQHATGLREFTLYSDIRVDVHGLRTDGQADGRYLQIDARGTSQDLLLFIDAPFDTGQAAASPDAMRDLVVRTGSGPAIVRIEGVLAGSIEAGRGGANIDVGTPGASQDMLGISTILSPEGRVTITARDLLATASDGSNQGFDDVQAATIAVNGGRIYVQNLLSSRDWDGSSRYKWIGASIATTGTGVDQVNFLTMADGTSITTGAGDDTVRVIGLGNQSVLAADSDNDGRGAVLDLGAGEDTVSFEDPESRDTTSTVIVGRDALVLGAERVVVEALDRVTVTTLSSPADTKHAFVGTRILDLQIENQTLAPQGEYYNDNDELDGSIEVDLQRFDSALELVMMTSHETEEIVVVGGTPFYRPGGPTTFTLHNVPLDVELILDAKEVTKALPTGGIAGLVRNELMTIDRLTGNVTLSPSARDHTLRLSPGDARGLNDALTLRLFNSFDLDLTIGGSTTDTVGNAASATDDDSMSLENLTLTLAPGPTSIDLNGFGDVAQRKFMPPTAGEDISSPVATSLAINTAGSSDVIDIDAVNADTIVVNGGVSTHRNESALMLRVDAANNYRITTIAGDDILDMRADIIRADDSESTVDRADHINLGDGFDTLIISGDNHLGSNDLQRNARATAGEDDVFMTLAGIEEILVDTDHGTAHATQMITLDDAAALNGPASTSRLQQLRFVGRDTHTVHLALGENYSLIPNDFVIADTLFLNASAHEGDFNLVLDSFARPNDSSRFDLFVHLRAAGQSAVSGDNLIILGSGDENQVLDVGLVTARGNISTRLFDGVANDVGDVGLTVASGSIDSIRLYDGNNQFAAGVETTSDTYIISSSWTRDNGQFLFDAFAIADTDNNTSTGGVLISAAASDARTTTLLGSQNNDTLIGGMGIDVIRGERGDDLLEGGAGNDHLSGGTGNDRLIGGAGDDTLDGEAGRDLAVYSGNRAGYQVARVDTNTIRVSATAGGEGVDNLSRIERLSFADAGIAFDLIGAAGIVAKTIGAVYGASMVGNKSLVGIGLKLVDQGMNYEGLMTLAINDRLQQNIRFDRVVELLYTNVVGVMPDDAAKAPFVALLQQGTLTVGELGMFAADDILNTSRIGLVGLAQTGLEFV